MSNSILTKSGDRTL